MDATLDARSHEQGVVMKKTKGHYFVDSGGRMVTCEVSARLRKVLIYPTADPNSLRPVVQSVREIETVDPVAVGDQVRFLDEHDGRGLILEVLPRRSRLSRLAAGPKPLEQVMVANLDQVVAVMAAAQPDPKWNLLDRYLVSAESLGLQVLIVIAKLDLLGEARELLAEVTNYRRLGYPVLLTSAEDGTGLDKLKSVLRGRISVLVGKSGVGKSSLLNALQPGLGLKVNTVSQATSKGRHTTTHLEMFPLDFGGGIVDTPGMREFGPWALDGEDVALCFPEMRPLVGSCKFGLDCRHEHEPGCEVIKAVDAGEVSERRYQSYLKLLEG